ncbi:prephenate dehydratase [Agathobaculum sp. NTUH-O15-33]|uniref:prephenate dehydratase n=1 Tax=Agathobaculum sp. NTUH-O15-33 TaxID=3079302 RepID=UPI0029589F48|nr:prephenate dehydratase [Agathobaculum sp. NTUH-O15-33]WNX83089.1 prephenate dehydratase [Agathobaculum sp. NTUH-O15-33]
MRDLPEIRADINGVDEQIRELFLKRMSLALEVAETKAETDDKIFKPDREAEILEKRAAGMEEELRLKYVALLQSMIRASREYQYSQTLRRAPSKFPIDAMPQALSPKTVYYQGVPGAYQELAARSLFPETEPQHVPTWEQVFQSVRDGVVDAGVVPVENTTAGTVSEVYDLLLQYDLSINRSTIKKIRHCLAAVPGASLGDVKQVCSHPHALPQCHDFIAEHGLEAIEVANTAIAAQNVAARGDKALAAICSRQAAELYGLSVLAEGINDLKHNETRFIAVSRNLTVQPEDNRIEIAFHIPNVAGSLRGVLDIFADYGVDMTEIHSRPMKDSPWCYVFYIDFTGNLNDHAVRAMLYQLYEELPYIKVIGSYRVAQTTEE